jgi:predicted nucleotidyltransferase
MISFEQINEVCRRIVEYFQPEKVLLFGSYASGNPGVDSDVDLLIILPFKGRSFDKSVEILCKVDPEFPVDLLARKPEDTERRYREGDPLIREAIDHGKVLYERDC